FRSRACHLSVLWGSLTAAPPSAILTVYPRRMHPEPATDGAQPQLKRALGPWDLTFLSVVAIANLNLVPVIAASGPITVWLWLAALLLFLLPQGIAVIELAHRYPVEGGLYVWSKEAFGDFHGFMCGWAYWTTNMFYLPTLLFYMGGILSYAGP